MVVKNPETFFSPNFCVDDTEEPEKIWFFVHKERSKKLKMPEEDLSGEDGKDRKRPEKTGKTEKR